jgi:hypothetical protein
MLDGLMRTVQYGLSRQTLDYIVPELCATDEMMMRMVMAGRGVQNLSNFVERPMMHDTLRYYHPCSQSWI